MIHDLLNRSQRNSIAIALGAVEMALRATETDLISREEGILYRREVTLSEEQRRQVAQLAASGLRVIAELAKRFELPTRTFDKTSTLVGQLLILQSDLYDRQARKLRRYGEVAAGLHEALDPALMELIDLLEGIVAVLKAQELRLGNE